MDKDLTYRGAATAQNQRKWQHPTVAGAFDVEYEVLWATTRYRTTKRVVISESICVVGGPGSQPPAPQPAKTTQHQCPMQVPADPRR